MMMFFVVLCNTSSAGRHRRTNHGPLPAPSPLEPSRRPGTAPVSSSRRMRRLHWKVDPCGCRKGNDVPIQPFHILGQGRPGSLVCACFLDLYAASRRSVLPVGLCRAANSLVGFSDNGYCGVQGFRSTRLGFRVDKVQDLGL